jgi:hypothetical protein
MDGPLQSIRAAIAGDVRDWSQDQTSIWVYGIVHGWPDMAAMARELGLSPEDAARWVRLQRAFAALAADEQQIPEERGGDCP